MKIKLPLPLWTIAAPFFSILALAGTWLGLGGAFMGVVAVVLTGSVLAAVHHAEVVAHRVGEPFGTLVLAVAITIIEVALVVSLIMAGGPDTATLARDTVFAAVMIILNGIIGICLLTGGLKFREQVFGLHGVSAALVTLTTILILALVLPNYTVSKAGPEYNKGQLILVALVSLVLYLTFVLVQTVRHRDFFLPRDADGREEVHADPPAGKVAVLSLVLLLICLAAVVALAKVLAPTIESAVAGIGAPKSLVGVIIAAVVLLPEGLAAFRAAKKNRLQTSLNLSLGSALASIGLTIPAVTVTSLFTGFKLTLGIDAKSIVLLLLSLFIIMLSLATGRTNMLQGIALLLIFIVYLFTTIVP